MRPGSTIEVITEGEECRHQSRVRAERDEKGAPRGVDAMNATCTTPPAQEHHRS